MKIFFILFLLCINTVHARPVTAQSWVVADAQGNIISGQNTTDIRAIASITKLVTAMVVLDSRQDLNQVIKVNKFKRTILTRREVMELALVHSDNQAADALCKHYRFGYKACIIAMNVKVQELGMHSTVLYDATGLNHGNVSTAEDLIKLVLASNNYSDILTAVQKGMVKVSSTMRKNKHKPRVSILTFVNTNPLVRRGDPVTVSKTGFNNASGGCLVMQMSTQVGERIVIVLGSHNTRTRFPEAEELLSTH